MAGLGRRTFAAGEVLTASNVMGYLQDQAVMNFAGTAARGSALPTPFEGATTYLQDNNFVQVHDGTAYRSLAGVQVVSGTATRAALFPSPIQGDTVFRNDLGVNETYWAASGTANPGGRSAAGWYQEPVGRVLQFQSTTKSTSFSTTSQTVTDVTGLSVTITPKFSTSRIVINANIPISHVGGNATYLSVWRDSTELGKVGAMTETVGPISFAYTANDSAATTSAITYKVRIYNLSGGAGTSYVNRWNINDTVFGHATISAMEVEA